MKIDEGVNGKIHGKVRQMLNSKALFKKVQLCIFTVRLINFKRTIKPDPCTKAQTCL